MFYGIVHLSVKSKRKVDVSHGTNKNVYEDIKCHSVFVLLKDFPEERDTYCVRMIRNRIK